MVILLPCHVSRSKYLPFTSSVAKPVIEIDGKLIEFGVSPVNLTCKSASDEDALGKYDWRRNNVIL